MEKEKIEQLVKEAVKKAGYKYTGDVLIQTPKDPKWGDYSSNIAMAIAKLSGKNPIVVAEKIVGAIGQKETFVEVVAPGFINFKLDQRILVKNLLQILAKKEDYGKNNLGKGKTVVVDYSSPNIAKPMSVGHLRTTIIGQAIYNLFKFSGFKTVGDNHLGDWGTQFGKLLVAYKKYWKSSKKITISDMLELYVKFHEKSKLDPQMEDEARKEFQLLEDGNKDNLKIWKNFREASVKEFDKIYKILGIKFDISLGESFYLPSLPNIINLALKKNIAKKSLGAIIIPVGEDLPPLLIEKKDKATLYATRDLATIKYREKKYSPEKIIYVIGNEQKLYLKQLFFAAKKLSLTNALLLHVGFGLMRMKEGKMSTRAGRIVYLENLIDEAIKRAKKIVEKKNSKLSSSEKEKIAKIVGVGAIKYNDLSMNRNSDIIFDYDKMLSLEGNSSPYLQYTYARAKSILRKTKESYQTDKLDKKLSINPSEEKVLKQLAKFPEVILNAQEKYQPNYIATYLFELANDFNFFYQENPVIKAPKDVKNLRLGIVAGTAQVIKNGLGLLGIDVLERM